MYPELFHIGSFPINTYGVFLALAFLFAILITVRLAVRDGLPREKIYDLSLWMLLASLIGSKVLMFWTEPEYREHPLQLFSLDFLRSGGVFYGGLIGAVLTGYFLMKRYKLPWWKTADACAPGIAIGNFLAGKAAFPQGAAGENRQLCRGASSSRKSVTKLQECPQTPIFTRLSSTNRLQCSSSFSFSSGCTDANASAGR